MRGARSTEGSRTWSKQAVYNLLRNRVYLGEASYGRGRGTLVIRRCTHCSTWNAPAAFLCWSCVGEDLDWAEVSGRATLHTFGIVHQISHPGFRDEVPYNVAVVELAEGPRMNSHIIECANEDLVVGMKLEVRFVPLPNGVTIPKFAPSRG